MKRTLIPELPCDVPSGLRSILPRGEVYDSSSSPEARVYFIDRDEGFFLKRSARGSLANEALMTSYFHTLGLGAEVIGYECDEYDWLLTRRVVGEDATCAEYLKSPKRLADIMGNELRRLHELDCSACPIKNRNEAYVALVEENYRTGNYDKSHFPDSFGYRSAEEAYAVFAEGRGDLTSEVLLHGDYCLPNIILDGWRLSGFIDVGNGGIGDRHIDLFWGAWTLWFNLGTDIYRDRFFDAYGRDGFNRDIIDVVAAAEVFG